MKNPFGSQLEEAYGPEHGVTIERNGLTYDVTIDGGPVHNVPSAAVADALNEAAEGASRADFLRILGVPEAGEAAAPAEDYEHDGDGPADVAGDAAEPDGDAPEAATEDPDDETDLDACPVCGSAGGEECRPGCDCEWCRGMAERDAAAQQTASDDGNGAPSAPPADPDPALAAEPATTATADLPRDAEGNLIVPENVVLRTEPVDVTAGLDQPQTPEAAAADALDAAIRERAKAYDGQGFAELRRVLTARRGTPTPRGTSRETIVLALARLDIEAAGPTAAGPTSAEAPVAVDPPEPDPTPEAAPPADDCDGAELGDTFVHTHPAAPVETPAASVAPAPETIPAAQAQTGRLYRHADGTLLRILSDADDRGYRMAGHFDRSGQMAGRMLLPKDQLFAVPDDTPLEPPTNHADPRIPAVGTVLQKDHQGQTWRLRVDHSGFTLIRPDGQREKTRSLSSAARTILGGTRVNGPAFWGLDDTPAARAEREAAKVARRRERQGLRLVKAVADWVDAGHVAPTVREALVALVGKLGGETGT